MLPPPLLEFPNANSNLNGKQGLFPSPPTNSYPFM